MASVPDPAQVEPQPERNRRRFRLRQLWYLLLLVQFFAVLITSIYARITPKLFGIPFFYWYQLLWIFISMILTAIVYVFTTDRHAEES